MLHSIARYILLTSSLLLPLYPLAAQTKPTIFPLHTFFQTNYDSTIIYQSGSTWYNSPNYLILAKHQGKVYFFTYTSPYQAARGRYFPGSLTKKFSQEELAFNRTPPDTNRYLLAGTAAPAALARCWREVAPTQLWRVQDDYRRQKPPGRCVIEDGDENTFYLIDKRAIKTAYFYAPAYYEECEGKSPDRGLAIKTIEALRALTQ
jgi:hypothetical protein